MPPIDLSIINGIKDLRGALTKHAQKIYPKRPIARVTHIAIHHSATTSGSAEAYARYHVNHNGWPGIGYHIVIEKDGTIKWCHDLETKSYHVGDSNGHTIGVCLTGDFKTQVPTPAQWGGLFRVIKALRQLLGIPATNILGHSEFPGYASKACPCLNMDQIRAQAAGKTPTPPATQAEQPTFSAAQQPDSPKDLLVVPGDKRDLLQRILAALKRKGYPLNQNAAKPTNLNIVGIRNGNRITNTFNDTICVFWLQDGAWQFRQYKATTDPGLYWIENPMNSAGTAIVKPGHYPNSHRIGLHHQQYQALVQASPLTVYRDFNRDLVIDWDNGKEQTGMFGINIHRSNASAESTLVNKWSAGCQVFANPKDFQSFMTLVNQCAAQWGDRFSYTLLLASEL